MTRTNLGGVLALIFIVMCIGACGGSRVEAKITNKDSQLGTVKISLKAIPAPQGVGVSFTGSYPVLVGLNKEINRNNTEIRNTIIEDERSFISAVNQQEIINRQAGIEPGGYNTYEVSPRGVALANSVLASLLLAKTQAFAGGVTFSDWISITLELSTGMKVAISDLFKDPKIALAVISKRSESILESNNSCFKGSIGMKGLSRLFESGLDPKSQNFRDFALTRTGLALGFPQDQIAEDSCGAIEAVIPYRYLRPYLSNLGIDLVTSSDG